MIASMFNLDHRLTELQPSTDERRLAGLRRAAVAAAAAATRVRRLIAPTRVRISDTRVIARPSKIAAG